MENTQNLKQLIEQQKAVVPFLLSLNLKERKPLLPVIQELWRKYDQREEKMVKREDGSSFKRWNAFVYPRIHRDLTLQAGVICAKTITEFRNTIAWFPAQYILEEVIVKEVLPVHVPKWFGRCLEQISSANTLYYPQMMELIKLGYFSPPDAFIANVLSWSIVRAKNGDKYGYGGKYADCSDELLVYPETLSTHFWWLFQYPSNINSRYFSHVPDFSTLEINPWVVTICRLIEQGRIDRMKVLEQCLLACTRGFNKKLLSWYYKMFKILEPTEEELVQLQPQLNTCLNAEESSVVTTALAMVKVILSVNGFDPMGVLNAAPQILSSSTKSAVNACLTILDRIAQQDKKLKKLVVQKVVFALAFEDEKIQLKSAKILKKHTEDVGAVADDWADYFPVLFSEAKNLLLELMPAGLIDDLNEETEEEDGLPPEKFDLLAEEFKISIPTDFDELLFFVNQVIDDNEPLHAELLIPCLSRLHSLITTENIDKLEPVFIRILNCIWNYSSWENSAFIHTASFYLNDYADFLSNRYKGSLSIRTKYVEKKISESSYYSDKLKTLRSKKNLVPIFNLVDQLFLKGQKLLFDEMPIDLLSTPTHFPCWVDPEVLIDRVLLFEENKVGIDLIDWQLALNRLPLGLPISDKIFAKLERVKTPYLKEVLLYYFDKVKYDQKNVDHFDYYLPLLLNKQDAAALESLSEIQGDQLTYLTQKYNWGYGDVAYEGRVYDTKSSKFKDAVLTKKALSITAQHVVLEEQGLLQQVKKIFKSSKKAQPLKGMYGYYDFQNKKNSYWTLIAKDVERYLMMTPNHPGLYLNHILTKGLERSEVQGEGMKRILRKTLSFLIEVWNDNDQIELVYLYLSACSLCDVKVVRQLVGELWVFAVGCDAMNQVRLGRITGRLLAKSYSGLKRLTDLIGGQLFNISPLHDRALIQFIGNVIVEMDDQPITNTKKLLEFFAELMQKESAPDLLEEIRPKLMIWQNTKSLKKVVNKILVDDKSV